MAEQKMVKPQTARVNVEPAKPTRQDGVMIQCVISQQTNERLMMELILRRRRGATSTVDGLLREMVEREQTNWPEPPPHN